MINENLGIIIVHFGSRHRTINCLESFIKAASFVRKNLPNVQIDIVIVDNAGNLKLQDCEINLEDRKKIFRVQVLRARKNWGYAGACFLGSKKLSHCSILIFSNNDIVVRKDSLYTLLKSLAQIPDSNIGAIQPLVINSITSKIDSVGLTSNPIMFGFHYAGFNYSNWSARSLKVFPVGTGLNIMECFGIDGMLFIIKRSTWDAVGGWDPEFFMFNEDLLLSWKLRLQGYTNYVALNSVVYHERGGTARGRYIKIDPLFSYYTSRNRMLSTLYIHKGIWLIIYFLISVLFEFVKNVRLSLWRKTAVHVYYYFKALFFILRNRKHIVSERAKVIIKISPREFIKKGFVVPISTTLAWLLKSGILTTGSLLSSRNREENL